MILTIFYILSAITLGTAAMTVLSRSAIHSAVYMVACFFSIAGHFMLLNAQFLAVVHIIVYTGAIIILLLFTLMLMNLSNEHESRKTLIARVAAAMSAGLLALVILAVLVKSQPIISAQQAASNDFSSVKVIGDVLLNDYLLPFEFTSVMLTVAMIGAVLVSKREKKVKS